MKGAITAMVTAIGVWGGSACAESPTGWVKHPSSLLLYDSSSTLVGEQPLGKWEEPAGVRMIVHETRGGTSRTGRFAWTWDLKTAWNLARNKKLEYRSIFKFFGPSGKELWEAPNAGAPASGEPVTLSDSGEVALLCERREGGFFVAVKSFIGNTLWELGPFPTLQSAELTPNGRYALLRWSEPDKASTHTFLSIAAKARKDIPSSELHLGKAAIDDDGTVLSGTKSIFSFSQAPKSP